MTKAKTDPAVCPDCGAPEGTFHNLGCPQVSHCDKHKQFEYDCIDCDDVRSNRANQASLRATEGADLHISIASVPHKDQRYDTCGDYRDIAGILSITVSQLADRREMLLVAIHELCEWAMCEAKGITNEEIDRFDLAVNGQDEPGDSSEAPYYHQHQIATGIERILAAELGVDWLTYERHLSELEYNPPVEPLANPPFDDDIPF